MRKHIFIFHEICRLHRQISWFHVHIFFNSPSLWRIYVWYMSFLFVFFPLFYIYISLHSHWLACLRPRPRKKNIKMDSYRRGRVASSPSVNGRCPTGSAMRNCLWYPNSTNLWWVGRVMIRSTFVDSVSLFLYRKAIQLPCWSPGKAPQRYVPLWLTGACSSAPWNA